MTGEDRATELAELRALEDKFAAAMQQLYVVGNELARMRHSVERSDAGASVTQGESAPAATAAPTPRIRTVPLAPPPHRSTPVAAPLPAEPVPAPAPAPAPMPASAHPASGPPLVTPQPPAGPYWAGTPGPTIPPAVAPGAPSPAQPTALGRWWQRESLVTRLLGITGAVVTLSGLVMLLVLAVQQRWFGPVPRVVAGVVLAAALIALAHVFHRREAAAGRAGHGAVALAGTGYAAAYLDVVAVTSIYGWVPAWAGLIVAAAIAGTGLWIARAWNSQILAALILLGAAMLAPFVTEGASWVLSAFLVVLCVASWPAEFGRSWPLVSAARLVPPVLIIVPTIFFAQRQPMEPWAHVTVTLVLALAGIAMGVREARSQRHDVSAATLALTALPLLVALNAVEQPWRTVVLLMAAVIWLGVAALGESQDWLPRATVASAAGVGTLALFLAIVMRSDTRWIGTALLVAAVAYVLTAAQTRSKVAIWLALVMTALGLVAYLRHPGTVLFQRTALRSDLAVTLIDSVIAAAVVAALAWLASRTIGLTRTMRRVIGISSWVAGLVVGTTALVAGGVLLGRAVDNAPAGFRAGHALATILWMLAAAWLLIRGLRRSRDADLSVWLGLGLAAGAVGKLFLYDLAALRGIWRVIAFIVVGLLLLATGAGYANALDRARAARTAPADGADGSDGADAPDSAGVPGPPPAPLTSTAPPAPPASPTPPTQS